MNVCFTYLSLPVSYQVPSGLLPVLEVDGRIFTESAVIMALLEDSFPDDKPLLPARGTQGRSRAEALMRLERRFFRWACSHGHNDTTPVAGGMYRHQMPYLD